MGVSLTQVFGHVDMEIGLELTMRLEDLGVPEAEIDEIMADYEMSQKRGIHRPQGFMKQVLQLYTIKDGTVMDEFRHYLYDPTLTRA